MDSGAPLAPFDLLAAVILGIAALRGLFLGLIREAFSIGALAAAFVAVRVFRIPFGEWLVELTGGAITPSWAPWVAAFGLVVAAIASVTILGRALKLGARVAGLGWADRAGGAALGLAEGALAAGALLIVASALLGRSHPLLAESRSLAALEQIERVTADGGDVADVAAPPPG